MFFLSINYCGAKHRWVKNLLKNTIILRIKKLKGSKALFFIETDFGDHY